MTKERVNMLGLAAIELLGRFTSHEWVDARKKYRRLLRVNEGWILIKSSAEVSSPVSAGQVTPLRENDAIAELAVMIHNGHLVTSR